MTLSRAYPSVRHRALPVVVALAVALALVWLASPRVVAAFAALPVSPVIAELRAGGHIDSRYLRIAAESQESALEWIDDGRGLGWLGLLTFLLAQDRGFDGEGRAFLDESVAAHRRGLAVSPAQTYAWLRLAHAELVREGPGPRLGPLIELSIVTAPYNYALVFRRLELCFMAWRQLDDRMRAVVAKQVRFAARYKPRRLAKLAKQRYATSIVRAALADVPDLRDSFDAALFRL